MMSIPSHIQPVSLYHVCKEGKERAIEMTKKNNRILEI